MRAVSGVGDSQLGAEQSLSTGEDAGQFSGLSEEGKNSSLHWQDERGHAQSLSQSHAYGCDKMTDKKQLGEEVSIWAYSFKL